MFLFGKRKKKGPTLVEIIQAVVDKLGEAERSDLSNGVGWMRYGDEFVAINHFINTESGFETLEVYLRGTAFNNCVFKAIRNQDYARKWRVDAHHAGDWSRYLSEMLYPKALESSKPLRSARLFGSINDGAIFKDVLEAKTDKTST